MIAPKGIVIFGSLASWAGVTAGMLALPNSPEPAVQPALSSEALLQAAPRLLFDGRFGIEETLHKTDRLASAVVEVPAKAVPVERAVKVETKIAKVDDDDAPRSHEAKRDGICKRGKVYYLKRHHWRSWRCRR
jgi:hypothetical protein